MPRFYLLLIICSFLMACSSERALELALKDEPVEQNVPQSRSPQSEREIPVGSFRTFVRTRRFRSSLVREWGDDVQLPTEHSFVKYTQNYLSRAIVDFDAGIITIETLDRRNPLVSLRKAAITALLTPDNPRAVDLYSTKEVDLEGTPFLLGLVIDQREQPIETKLQASMYAKYLVNKHRQTRKVSTADGRKTLHSITLKMVNRHLDVQANRYAAYVKRYADEYGVSSSLIYAVMKTESNFNMFAVSSAPAYGLMQLVPTSGGRDAYRYAKGKDIIPSQDYLFQPDNNIELGTAYLSLLNTEAYLGKIKNPATREYCVISAYNGGIGTVLKLFGKDKQKALRIINSSTPEQVHEMLRTKHPFKETRQYIVKVMTAKKEFTHL